MAYQALYRKLRPRRFEDVIGQDEIVKTLKNQIKNNHIAHAYLFCGTRGTGKTSLAKILANAVNCEHTNNQEPCGKCEVCKSFLDETNVDIIELDAASRNGVDDMRDLLEKVSYPPQNGKYKVYIIDEVHMLSISAFNALLKTLEEPPQHVIFVLATTESQKIPATILSRCQKYDLSRVSLKHLSDIIKNTLSTLSINYDEDSVYHIAVAADGSVRDCLSILDICISGINTGDTLSIDHVNNMLGTSSKSFVSEFANHIISQDYLSISKACNELILSGKDPLVFLKQLSEYFRNIMLAKFDENNEIDERISNEQFKILLEQSKNLSTERLIYIIDIFMKAETSLKWSSSPRIGLESASVKAAMPQSNDTNPMLMVPFYNDLVHKMDILSGKFSSSAYKESTENRSVEIQKAKSDIVKSDNNKTDRKMIYDQNTMNVFRLLGDTIEGLNFDLLSCTSRILKGDNEYIISTSNEYIYSALKKNIDNIINTIKKEVSEDYSVRLLEIQKTQNVNSQEFCDEMIKQIEESSNIKVEVI